MLSSALRPARTSGPRSQQRRSAETLDLDFQSVTDGLTTSHSTPVTPQLGGRGLDTATTHLSFGPTTLRKVLVRTGEPPQHYAHHATGAVADSAGGQATNAIDAMAETVSSVSSLATHVPLPPGSYRGPMIVDNGTMPRLRASGTAGLGTTLAYEVQELPDTLTETKFNVLPMVQAPVWTSGDKGAFFFVPITPGRESVELEETLSTGQPLYQANGEFSATGVFLVDGVPLLKLTGNSSRIVTTEHALAAESSNALSSSADSMNVTEAPAPTHVSPDVQLRWLGRGKPKTTAHATKPVSHAAKPTAGKGGGLLGHLAKGVKSAVGGHGIAMPKTKTQTHHTGKPTATATAHAKTGHGKSIHTAVHEPSGPHPTGGHGSEHSAPHGQQAHGHATQNDTMATPTGVSDLGGGHAQEHSSHPPSKPQSEASGEDGLLGPTSADEVGVAGGDEAGAVGEDEVGAAGEDGVGSASGSENSEATHMEEPGVGL